MSALLSKTHQMARNENDQQMTRVEVFSKSSSEGQRDWNINKNRLFLCEPEICPGYFYLPTGEQHALKDER